MRSESEIIKELEHLRWLKKDTWDFFNDIGKNNIMQEIVTLEWVLGQSDKSQIDAKLSILDYET